MRENTYLSRTIEVQENQKVIDTCLYGDVIKILAEKVTGNGYQVLSFDLPEHRERKVYIRKWRALFPYKRTIKLL